MRQFSDIFESIHDERATFGLLPVENSLAGTVIRAYDALIDYDLRVRGEIILPVRHCLLAPEGTQLDQIKRAVSHPQALAQCADTLQRLGIEPVAYYDTAGAAKDLAAQPEPNTAAIASAFAGETYGMSIIARDLQDRPHNYTRFFVIGTTVAPRSEPCKTSIVFTTRHEPGALYRVMGELVNRDINLSKIESRPRRNRRHR